MRDDLHRVDAAHLRGQAALRAGEDVAGQHQGHALARQGLLNLRAHLLHALVRHGADDDELVEDAGRLGRVQGGKGRIPGGGGDDEVDVCGAARSAARRRVSAVCCFPGTS